MHSVARTTVYHGLLGLAPPATAAEVRAAYLQKVKVLHPDKTGTPNRAEFQEVQEAYTELLKLLRSGPPPSPAQQPAPPPPPPRHAPQEPAPPPPPPGSSHPQAPSHPPPPPPPPTQQLRALPMEPPPPAIPPTHVPADDAKALRLLQLIASQKTHFRDSRGLYSRQWEIGEDAHAEQWRIGTWLSKKKFCRLLQAHWGTMFATFGLPREVSPTPAPPPPQPPREDSPAPPSPAPSRIPRGGSPPPPPPPPQDAGRDSAASNWTERNGKWSKVAPCEDPGYELVD